MTAPSPTRFYDTVAVVPAEEGGWAVRLDGRAVRTPARRLQIAPTQALAELVADEWRAQDEVIDLARMHAMRLLNAALDRTPAARAELCDQVRAYAETDLVCHLSDGDPALRAAQEAAWGPVRDWAWRSLGVALEPVYGVIAAAQPPASLDAARAAADALDDFRLTGMSYAMGLLGSAVLAFALERGRLDGAGAFALSRLDEAHQEARWGVDEEAAARAAALAQELTVAERFLRSLDPA